MYPVRAVLSDCGVKRCGVCVSSSRVLPAGGSWSSSGGKEPEDGVRDSRHGSGCEFIVMVVIKDVFLADDGHLSASATNSWSIMVSLRVPHS